MLIYSQILTWRRAAPCKEFTVVVLLCHGGMQITGKQAQAMVSADSFTFLPQERRHMFVCMPVSVHIQVYTCACVVVLQRYTAWHLKCARHKC